MSIAKLQTTFPAKYNLYYPSGSGERSGQFDLFIRILPEPASRLYSGKKIFELRKYVPRHAGFVFLFESGRVNAVTGCFYFRDIIVDSVERLWERVGTKATRREKFDAYFATKTEGVALEVLGVERFAEPLAYSELLGRFSDFPKAPEPYVYLYTPIGGELSVLLRSRVPSLVARFQA